MLAYTIRRLVIGFFTFLMATILIFILIELPPGDYVDYTMGSKMERGQDAGSMAKDLREYYGLNQPMYKRYLKWVSGIFRGDFGWSLLYRKPTIEVIGGEFLWTFVVAISSYAFAWFFGILLGIYSAVHQYSFGDTVLTFFAFIGISIPNFFLALFLIYVMVQYGTGVSTGLFSSQFVGAPWSWPKFIDLIKHLWMPIIAVGTAQMARIMRFMRGNLLEVLGKPYIDTARAKGLSESLVIVKHAVRNAINPLISIAGMQAPRLISGMVVTAVVLDLPVIGPTFLDALNAQDMFLAGGYLLVIIVLLIIGNLFADLLLAFTNPQITYN